MTVKQTCAVLDISRDTLYRRMKAGTILPVPRNLAQSKTPLKFLRADVLALAQPRPKDKPLSG